MRNLPEIEDSTLKQLPTEIGRGCFGICTLAKYGARTVVLKKQDDFVASKNEARMIAKLSHSNIVCLIGVMERQNRLDIVTNFYSVNGDRINLCDIPAQTTTVNWKNLLSGLCSGIRYLHNKAAKVLHNDIKSNNVVLDGCDLFGAQAVLLDFGKATNRNSPKIYKKPADTRKFRHLAPELGQVNGKQSNKSDVYSLGYMIRSLNYKHQNFPSMFVNIYRSCLRTSPSQRASASDICEQFDNLPGKIVEVDLGIKKMSSASFAIRNNFACSVCDKSLLSSISGHSNLELDETPYTVVFRKVALIDTQSE